MEALFSDYETIRKSGLFDPEYYLSTYPEVADGNLDPLVHYLEEGARQGRNPHRDFDTEFYLEQCRRRGEAPPNPLIHYIRVGAARGFKTRRDGKRKPSRPAPAEAPDRAGKSPILVALESLGIVGGPAGASRLSVSGWALAAAPISDITVALAGEVLGTATYGLARPDVARLYPDRAGAATCGFILAFDLPRGASGAIEPLLTVRTVDGELGQRPLQVEIPPQQVDVGTLDPQHRTRVEAAPGAEPPREDGEAAGGAGRKLQVDTPQIIDGRAVTPVLGNLEIGGWALARAGVAAIEVAIDGTLVALADYGLRRLDIHAAFPDWDAALASGFSALLPHRILPAGSHRVSVTLRDKRGGTTVADFSIEVGELSDAPGPWALRRRIAPAESDLLTRVVQRCGREPWFIAVLPVGDGRGSLAAARATVASVCRQAYPNWRLVIVPRRAAGRAGAAVLEAMGTLQEHGEVVAELTPETLAATVSRLGAAAAQVFVAVLSPGDELGCDAFLEMAVAAAIDADADFLYSDERAVNPATDAVEAFFKPDWSPDLLSSTNYIGRLWCARADLLAGDAAAGEKLLRHGEYDLLLRLTERAQAIRHLPAILCERGKDAAGRPAEERLALERMLARRGIAGEVGPGLVAGSYRLKRTLGRRGLVSIVIPTCAAGGLIETCIASLRRLTAYRDFEIICIENIPPRQRKWRQWLRRNADRVISTADAFNWSRFNNLAAAEAKGEYLVFLNDDIEITDPEWLDVLLEEAQRPEVGVVGPRLLYPDGRVQHAGMFLAAMGQGRHAFRYAGEHDPGYFGLALTRRNVIAVTGACLMTRRDTFDALGGFDEAQAVINNDLDFCLRAWRSGLVNIYTPYARLIHHEAVSRAGLADDYDAAAFDGSWRDLFLAGDPYFNRHLSKNHDDFVVEHEPTELLVTGRPSLSRDAISKILVVKLDHIGDCVIALPAVRRLKHHFPLARISVLTSQASQPVWQMEPSVDETIVFDFFHARSALGQIEHSDNDWRELRARLVAERFDLAIDLRKHLETRPVLQHSGARTLAGFDFRNQFPWLDVAIEWGGDQIYARKRQHNGDDLVNLVDAVAAACEPDRSLILTRPAPVPVAGLPPGGADGGPLVCVHPTAGNDMKQWPIAYFAAVIDRLVAADRARVVIIGAAGDEPVAADLLRLVRHRGGVTSLVGKVPLADLPGLIAGMSLFLGNDSGPKHIAAGLGVPTVGVHAGTVDVREWGPVGPAAVAVARSVVCSPCYLSQLEDCRRGLACVRELDPAQVYDACRRLLPLGGAAPAAHPVGKAGALRKPTRGAGSTTGVLRDGRSAACSG